MKMKNLMRKVCLALMALPFFFSLVSCEKKNETPAFTPSAELQKTFEADFPGATDAAWVQYDIYAVVSFSVPAKSAANRMTAWYTNTDDPKLMQKQQALSSDSDMLPASVPQAVKDAFNASVYNDPSVWRLDEVEIHYRYYEETPRTVYKIELDAIQAGKYDVDLFYDETGKLLKEEIDYDDIDDTGREWDDDDMPIDPGMMDKYIQFVNQKYPDYEIDEIERKHTRVEGYTTIIEVELEKRGLDEERNVYLNVDASWIATSKEIRFMELPQAIISKISAQYAGWEKEDEAEEWETAQNTTVYSIELEQENRNEDIEMLVFFDASGNVLKEIRKFD